MSYTNRRYGLHGLAAGDTYPSGTQVVGGFQVIGLASTAASGARQKLRDAVAASFPFGSAAPAGSVPRDSVGWGPAYGVPEGRLYAMVTTNRDGVTGAEINSAWINVARDLRTRLGLTVNLTNAHTIGGAAPLPALTPDVGPDGNPAPVDPGGTTSPLVVGGIVVGGLAAVAATLAFVMRRRPVSRNRGRRRR